MSINMENIQNAQQFNALSMRLMHAMMNAMPGKATNKVIEDLQKIYDEYHNLLKQRSSTTPLFTHHDVKAKMAETLEWIARARDSMADWQGAVTAFEKAKKAFSELDDQVGIKRCQEIIDKIHVGEGIDIDKRLNELLTRQSKLKHNTLEYVQTLVQIADLSAGNDDFFEADKYYQKALTSLHKQGRAEPSGVELANSLSSSISKIMSGQGDAANPEVVEALQIRDLYRQIYMGQVRVFRALAPDRVAEVDAKLKALEGSERRQDFTKELKNLMESTLGNYFK